MSMVQLGSVQGNTLRSRTSHDMSPKRYLNLNKASFMPPSPFNRDELVELLRNEELAELNGP
jgi:hypothetical protein